MINFHNDSILVAEIFKKNEEALEYLYHRYFRRLKGYAYRFVEDEDVAQDVVQECYIKLWEKSEELIGISIRSLLFTMVRNRSINFLKKQQRIEKLFSEYIAQLDEDNLYYADFNVYGKEIYSELEQELRKVIDTLPERCKEIFLLSRKEGLKNREIAEKLEISTTAVEKHISRAFKQIEEYLKYNVFM